MATLKEFEDSLREHGMHAALAILETLRVRDRSKRQVAPARRVTGQKMTPELARSILELHASTGMTQQEIAFKVGVNQGRVNEVIKRGKWLSGNPAAPEAVARDRALAKMSGSSPAPKSRRSAPGLLHRPAPAKASSARPVRRVEAAPQLDLGDL